MESIHPLKQWRITHSLKQEAVAERVGVTKATISRWEKRRRQPSLAQAAKLSEETGIPLDQFVRQEVAA